MSGLYKRGRYWHYDFQQEGVRFTGSTKRETKRDAQDWLRAYKTELETSGGRKTMTVAALFDRWYEARGQWRKKPEAVLANLERLMHWLGPETTVHKIGTQTISLLVAERRGQTRVRLTGKVREAIPLTNATVNRLDVEFLRAIWNQADKWGIRVDRIDWPSLKLKEPRERVRALSADEYERLHDALRDDLRPVFVFSVATGVRLEEAIGLKWSDIDHGTMTFQIPAKGGVEGEQETLPLIPEVLHIIGQQSGNHPERVWTYVAQHTRREPRTGERRIQGQRYPLTRYALRRPFQAALREAGITDYRWHDNRHTAATEALRASGGNLKLVQRMLRHASIQTTARYAHVMDDDLREAMSNAAKSRNSPAKLKALKRKAKGN